MEEFIFDDEVDGVGAETEAHCPKCRADTHHLIVAKYEDEIRRVQCQTCNDVHAYRKPRGGEEEEETPGPKKKVKVKPTWDLFFAKNKKQPKPYNVSEFFRDGEVVEHPTFGLGFVVENIGKDKVEIQFKEDKRTLVHNRANLKLTLAMPARLKGPIVMAPQKGAKGKAAKESKEAPPPPPAKAAPAKGGSAKGSKAAPPAKAAPAKAPPPKSAAKPAKPAQAKAAAPAKGAKPAAKAAKPSKPAAKPAPKKPVKAAKKK